MNAQVPDCPACRMRMQEGVVYYPGDRGRLARGVWAEGPPRKSLLQGYTVKGRPQYEAVTFRCPSCGWLISFAPQSKEEAGD